MRINPEVSRASSPTMPPRVTRARPEESPRFWRNEGILQERGAAFPKADPVHLRRSGLLLVDACVAAQATLGTELPLLRKGRDVVSLVRESLPEDDASLQLSGVISGTTEAPSRTLDELFERYVGRYAETPQRQARDDEMIWRDFAERIDDAEILRELRPALIHGRFNQDMNFRHTYRNGSLNALHAVSLDLVEAETIRSKASTLYGKLDLLDYTTDPLRVQLVLGLPGKDRPKEVRLAASDSADMLRQALGDFVTVFREQDADALAAKVRADIAGHKSSGSA